MVPPLPLTMYVLINTKAYEVTMIPKNINGKSLPPSYGPKILPVTAGNIERLQPSHMKLRITKSV